MLAACSCRSQLGRADLIQPLLKLPAPSTHADADVARVTINSAEMMRLQVKLTKLGYHKRIERLLLPRTLAWVVGLRMKHYFCHVS